MSVRWIKDKRWRGCHDVFLLRSALNNNLLIFMVFYKGHSLNESFVTARFVR